MILKWNSHIIVSQSDVSLNAHDYFAYNVFGKERKTKVIFNIHFFVKK